MREESEVLVGKGLLGEEGGKGGDDDETMIILHSTHWITDRHEIYLYRRAKSVQRAG